MSDGQITSDAAETVTEDATTAVEQPEIKPTETVEHWKAKARDWEKRAKDNSAAAKELNELKESQKSDAEKAADRLSKAEAEVALVPQKVAEALRSHLVALHGISDEDAELFLTASDPDVLLKQVGRLVDQAGQRVKKNHVPREGRNTSPGEDQMRGFVRKMFSAEKE